MGVGCAKGPAAVSKIQSKCGGDSMQWTKVLLVVRVAQWGWGEKRGDNVSFSLEHLNSTFWILHVLVHIFIEKKEKNKFRIFFFCSSVNY